MSEVNDASTTETTNLQSSRQTVLRSGVLRPSVLGVSVLSSGNGSTAFGGLAAADAPKEKDVAANPFMKEQKDENEDSDAAEGSSSAAVDAFAKTKEAEAESKKKIEEDDEEPDERPDPLTLLRKNGLERANLFAAAKNSIPRVEKSGFVFGQNVHERVIGENINADSASKSSNSDSVSTSGELLFSSVIQNAKSTEADSTATKEKDNEAKSLTEVAREYEESRAQKRKYEEVATFTGEENELNIVDINCKLFAFVNSNWEERGRGSLRLNDSLKRQECSRVVFRTSGNLRLLLNTKVWAGMVAERPSQKSLRLTAMDNTGKIKIFLAMARPVDINLLHSALVERIDARKASHPNECQPADEDNNGTEEKNGASGLDSADVIDGDDGLDDAPTADDEPKKTDVSAEPSPKKTLLTTTDTVTTTDTNN